MTYRYCNILNLVFLCMMYSSGIPVLYPICAFYFAVTYWFDKYMLFRWYKRPVMLDNYIAMRTLSWFKFALLLHVLIGVVMYSNNEILKTNVSDEWFKNNFEVYLRGWSMTQLLEVHNLIFILAFLIMIFMWLFWNIFAKTCCKCICKDKSRDMISENFAFTT